MKRAVHSFWFRPLALSGSARAAGGFMNEKAFVTAWALSATLARKWFEELEFVTDQQGADLVRRLQLPYTRVSRPLKDLKIRAEFWNAGKFIAYLTQDEPFVHLDIDVFLYDRLPVNVLSSPIFGQSYETADHYRQFYQTALSRMTRAEVQLPSAWIVNESPALNCGVMGGHDLSLIHEYAESVLMTLTQPENEIAWDRISQGVTGGQALWHCSVAIEQIGIIAAAAKKGFAPMCVFDFDPNVEVLRTRDRYLHLMHTAKRSPDIIQQISEQLYRLDPELWKRVEEYFLA